MECSQGYGQSQRKGWGGDGQKWEEGFRVRVKVRVRVGVRVWVRVKVRIRVRVRIKVRERVAMSTCRLAAIRRPSGQTQPAASLCLL